MKLVRFMAAGSATASFGVVIRNHAVPFVALQSKAAKPSPHLDNIRSYLANLPGSEQAAKELLTWGEQHFEELGQGERFPLEAVRLLEPIEVVALFDFGLTPRASQELGRNNREVREGQPANRSALASVRGKPSWPPKPSHLPVSPNRCRTTRAT
jgi:hypothetical protein